LKKNRLLFILKLTFSVSVITFLLYEIGIKKISTVLLQVNPGICIVVVACIVLSFAMNGFALWLILETYAVDMMNCIKVSALSWAWGVLTPGRLGELSLIVYFKKFKIPTGFSVLLFLVMRIVTLLYLIIFAFLGLYLFGGVSHIYLYIAFMFIALCLIAVFFQSTTLKNIIKKLISKKYNDRFSDIWSHFRTLFLFRKRIFIFSVIQLIKLMVLFFITKYIFSAFGSDVDYIDVCIINSIARISSLIPVSINGLGVKEGIQIYLFNQFSGVSLSVVAGVSIIINIVIYIFAFIWIFHGSQHTGQE